MLTCQSCLVCSCKDVVDVTWDMTEVCEATQALAIPAAPRCLVGCTDDYNVYTAHTLNSSSSSSSSSCRDSNCDNYFLHVKTGGLWASVEQHIMEDSLKKVHLPRRTMTGSALTQSHRKILRLQWVDCQPAVPGVETAYADHGSPKHSDTFFIV